VLEYLSFIIPLFLVKLTSVPNVVMLNPIKRYTHWLHTCWPAGVVEKLAGVGEFGATNIPGVRIVGDLTGIPLLKFSSKTGAEAVHADFAGAGFCSRGVDPGNSGRSSGKPASTFPGCSDEVLDLAIIGGGVSGVSAAIEARKGRAELSDFRGEPSRSRRSRTFPKAKPIYTYPTDLSLKGGLQFTTDVKEALLEEAGGTAQGGWNRVYRSQDRARRKRGDEILLHSATTIQKQPTRARRVIVAIGRSGNHRRLGCPGEDLDKVYNRLTTQRIYRQGRSRGRRGRQRAGMCHRAGRLGREGDGKLSQPEFARPKPENVEKLKMLEHDPKADVQVERPSSERVTTAFTSEMMKAAPPGSVTLAMATIVSGSVRTT
jgi:hypothetical protein